MVSDYRQVRPIGSASTHIHQLSSNLYFTEQVHPGSFMGPELGRTQHQFFTSDNLQSPSPSVSGSYMGPELGRTLHQLFTSQNQQSPRPTVSGSYMGSELGRTQHQLFISNHQQSPTPGPHPRPLLHYVQGMHEAVQREIEKERIREEIMSEIVRRRELEAEVRRELMMEMELGVWRGRDGLPFAPPSLMGFGSSLRLPVVEARDGRSYVEERIISSLAERETLYGRRESGVFESLPFQRGSAELRNLEVKPAPDGAKEKGREKIILLPKPSENISGVKRETPSGEFPSESNSRKKSREDWSCALCQVSTTSQQALNEHLQGKKHKSSEAGLKARSSGKNYIIGLFPKKPAKPTPGTDKVAPPSLPFDDKASSVIRDQPLLEEQPNLGKFEQNKKQVVGQETQSGSNHTKKYFKFTCDLCQIGCHSPKVFNSHLAGKKHKARVAMSERSRGDEKNNAVDEKNNEPRSPKVENDGPAKEDTSAEDCGAVVVNDPINHDLTMAEDMDQPSPMEVETIEKDVNGLVEEAAADDGGTAIVNEPDLKAGVGGLIEPKDSKRTNMFHT